MLPDSFENRVNCYILMTFSTDFVDKFHKDGDKPVGKRFPLNLCFVHSDSSVLLKVI